MKHTDFERNSALENRPKNPFVTRCNLIVLKVAIRRAETVVLEQIGTPIKLDNTNAGLAYLRDAKTALIIALQDDCTSEQKLFEIANSLSQAHKHVPIAAVLDCWEQSLDFIADFPIPYRLGENAPESPIGNIPCKCGNVMTQEFEIARGFCVHCAYGWNDPETKPVAFDNRLVTGDVEYGGDWHRCIEIARYCIEKSLWDGKSKLHICGDIQAMHRHIFFMREEPSVAEQSGYPGQAFCYINLLDVPVKIGGAK